jgi:cytochrome c peroxidase
MKRTVVAVLLLAAACKGKSEPPPPAEPAGAGSAQPAAPARPALDAAAARAQFKALPARFDVAENPATPEKIVLGRTLYYDTRLSKSQELSCASCHDLSKGGADAGPTSKGHNGKLGGRNSPTVFNAAGHMAQFWDGRAANVEEQAKGPVLNPVEMAMPDAAAVVKVLKSIPGYADMFKKAFPGDADPITYDNMAKAIGAFERGVVTPSRFDAFLGGKDDALTQAEKDGLATYMASGCPTCHQGVLLGGAMYMKLGLVEPYSNTADQGRFDITKQDADKMVFKVPSLRNIADTAPYYHDGSIADLPSAVKSMAKLQLGKQLPDSDVDAIVAFLKALSAPPAAEYIAKPELPASGPKTPKPDKT